jgi:hypoxanthine-DNA glycosylase
MKSEVGLWDVLESCERIGSLDATIVSEKCQNFEQLFNVYPGIASILCNGSKAYISFLRLVVPTLGVDRLVGRRIEKLPSTSPANASYSMDKLMQAWSTAFGYGFAEGVDVLLRLRAND